MFEFLKHIFRPTVIVDAHSLPVVNSAEMPMPSRPERTRPSHLQFDSTEPSEFGTQVMMLLSLQPDAWRIHDSLRLFAHPELGLFEFDANDRLQHCGTDVRTSSYDTSVPGKQRALTLGDHHQISEALQALLLSPMAIGQPVGGDGEVAVYRGKQRPTGKKGDLWYNESNRLHRHDGAEWVEQSAAVGITAQSVAAQNGALMQQLQALQNQNMKQLIDPMLTNQFAGLLTNAVPRPPLPQPAAPTLPQPGAMPPKYPGA